MKIYQIDAFAQNVFGGNPAAVCPLENWLPDEVLQKIAMENNLSETAYFVKKDADYELRWFTPEVEVNLCGHATISAAFVLFFLLNYKEDEIRFHTKSGLLTVRRKEDLLTMSLPLDTITPIPTSVELIQAINVTPVETVKGKNVLLTVVENETVLQNLNPDFVAIKKLHPHGLIVTAKGNEADFVSRCFFPNYGINEDPVTGSAHAILTSYWNSKTGKTKFNARQISKRTGDLICELTNDRVEISGQAVLYMTGEINL